MAKVSEKAKRKYAESIKGYKKVIATLLEKEHKSRLPLKKGDYSANKTRIELADLNVTLVSYYVVLNQVSLSMLGVKNENYLNEGRKACYKAIIYLEEAFTNLIDASFSEYESCHEQVVNVNDRVRYQVIQKLGFSIQSVEDGFGANSKWKWSFVELYGRFSVVAKNILDLKSLYKKLDPRFEFYNECLEHLQIVKRMLQRSADKYREKYELSTQRIDDMRMAINYLAAYKRIIIVLGETNQLENIKKKIEVWMTKMESDIKKKEVGNKPR
ncbi:MAG: hypothetical protein JXR70_00100 [Spirochaetales bacterium]|nr:hypothetical protein [Spirochaetales bacterium]